MKKLIIILFVTVYVACNTDVNSEKNLPTINQIVSYENFEYNDTLHVKRENVDANINLVFPAMGQKVELYLFDFETYKKRQVLPIDTSLRYLRTDEVKSLEKLPTINIKDLPDGIYHLDIVSKVYPEGKWITIQTKN